MNLKDPWTSDSIRQEPYGAAFLYLEPSEKGSTSIRTQKDLIAAVSDFETEINWVGELITYLETHSIQQLFSRHDFYQNTIDKLNGSVTRLGNFHNLPAIACCMLCYHFSGNKTIVADMLTLHDRVSIDSSKAVIKRAMEKAGANQ